MLSKKRYDARGVAGLPPLPAYPVSCRSQCPCSLYSGNPTATPTTVSWTRGELLATKLASCLSSFANTHSSLHNRPGTHC